MVKTLSPNAHVVPSIHDDGLVLFDPVTGNLYTSNRVGAQIWQGLERGSRIDAIAADLSRQYDLSPDRAYAHAMRFLTQLEEQSLVTRQ